MVSPSFVIFFVPNDLGWSRLGLTVTRKLGNAVVRNRTKRIVREIFRKNREAFEVSNDYVVNARSGVQKRSYAQLETELLKSVARRKGEPRT